MVALIAIPNIPQMQQNIIMRAIMVEGAKASDIQSLARRAQVLSNKVDWWNNRIIWVLAFAAAIAVGTVLVTYMAFRRAKQFADAQGDLNAAKEQNLQDDLAHKSYTIAELGKQTAELTSQNLQLEAVIAPRRLSDRQKTALANLTRFGGRLIEVKSYASDTEGLVLATQILDALAKAKLSLLDNRFTAQASGSISLGVSIEGYDKELIVELHKILSMDGHLTALSSIGAPNKGSVMFQFSPPPVPPAATIFVGPKPISLE
jgi:hypothetical protein